MEKKAEKDARRAEAGPEAIKNHLEVEPRTRNRRRAQDAFSVANEQRQ